MSQLYLGVHAILCSEPLACEIMFAKTVSDSRKLQILHPCAEVWSRSIQKWPFKGCDARCIWYRPNIVLVVV